MSDQTFKYWESDLQKQRRKKIIGVMGGGSTPNPDLPDVLGKLIAKLGHHLLTGAGEGIMEAVSKSFYESPERKGLVLGIVRADPDIVKDISSGPRKYAPNKINKWIEIPIYTHLRRSNKSWDSRNHINVLTSDVVVVLPGGPGTESEVELALEYEVPVVFFVGEGLIHKSRPTDYKAKYPTSPIAIAEDIGAVEAAINSYLGKFSM